MVEIRFVGYARVSTQEQNLDLQLDALRKFGVFEDNLHFDKASGTSKKRPGLKDALMDCRDGDTLVVWKLDRLTRSPPQLYALLDQLKAKGVGLVSLTEMLDTKSAVGRLVMGITTAVSAFERDLIAERTKAGLDAIRAKLKDGEKWEWGRKRIMTDAKIARAGKLLNSGKTGPQVAEQFQVSAASIYAFWRWDTQKQKWVRKDS